MDAAPPPLRAFLLGPVRILVGDTTIPDRAWSRRAARSLLLLLLITPGHRLPRDRVLDLLWPDAVPDSAEGALRKAVHLLRRVLQPGLRSGRDSAYLDVSAETIGLRSGIDLWLDAAAFESALATVTTASAGTRRSDLREALHLYAGDLLDDEPYADWADAPRQRLQGLHRRAVLDLDAGEPAATVPALERILETDGTDEGVLRALMRALAEAGRGDDALRRYRHAVATLQVELDAEPESESRALADEIRTLTTAIPPPLRQPIAIRPHAVIPASPNLLVGRQRDVERVQDLLLTRDVRLVTVTGAGGVGKTRVAQEAARQLAEDVADGVCQVVLTAIRDPSRVLPEIARALGLAEDDRHTPGDILRAALQGREVLLVLDNVEQVIEAATDIADLLDGCDRLKVLATSREPLRIRAEHEVLLSGLAVPPASSVRNRRLTRYGAIELFLRRAHAVQPTFVLTDDNVSAIVAICTRLDGLPLAIELAAAQTRAFSPDQVLAGLDDRFAVCRYAEPARSPPIRLALCPNGRRRLSSQAVSDGNATGRNGGHRGDGDPERPDSALQGRLRRDRRGPDGHHPRGARRP